LARFSSIDRFFAAAGTQIAISGTRGQLVSYGFLDRFIAPWKGIWEFQRMPAITDVLILGTVVAIQVAGAISVIGARLSERAWAKSLFQRSFFVCLLIIGATTMAAIYCGKGTWLPSAATLGLMSVGATLDCGSRRHSPAF
jgi:hypothetical protein